MLVYDYDGVLLNSLDDVVLSSWNAIHQSTLTSVEKLPASYVDSMRRNRFHCQPAGDFLVLAQALMDNEKYDPGTTLDIQQYKELLIAETTPLPHRTKKFFDARNRLVSKNEKAWLNLNSVYQPLWSRLIELKKDLIILTNKNKKSVISSATHFGLNLDPTNIYSGDNSVSKEENLIKILARYSFREITFIDDSIKNLLNLRKFTQSKIPQLNFIPILAEWGFNSEDCKSLATREGILTMDQDTFIETELG